MNITLRNIPPDIARAIYRKAKDDRTSLNRTVINMLLDTVDTPKRIRYRDLSDLAGSWTKEQADEFDQDVAEQRKIDPEMWK